MSRVLSIAACSLALLGCHRAPPDPSRSEPSPTAVTPARGDTTPAYRPGADAVRTRLLAYLTTHRTDAEATATGEIREVRHLDVANVPPDLDAWGFRDGSDTWHTAVVTERDLAVGLEGAERVLAARSARNETMTAVELTRLVGTLHYYPWRIYDGHDWIGAAGDTPTTMGATPNVFSRPNVAGRVLMFSYAIPDGAAGAGIHVANIRITDSGYLIDAAPRPDRR